MLDVSVVWARTHPRDELRTVVRFAAHDGPILREANRALRGRVIDAPPPLGAAEGFAAHLDTEFAAGSAFFWDPSVDATNWRAEQAAGTAPLSSPAMSAAERGAAPGALTLLAW